MLECLNLMSRKTQRARKVKSISTFISVQQRSLSTHTNVQKVKWIYSATYSVCVALSIHNMPTVETALTNEISWQHMCNRIVSVAMHSKSLAGQIYCCKMPISSQYCNLAPLDLPFFKWSFHMRYFAVGKNRLLNNKKTPNICCYYYDYRT